MLRATRFIHKTTDETEAVYVGYTDHSKTFITPTKVYWILGRKIGLKHHQLEPGLTTEDHVQEKMIQDIQKNSINWIILIENPPSGDRDFQRRAYKGSSKLDSFIQSKFKSIRVFGKYTVLRRIGT